MNGWLVTRRRLLPPGEPGAGRRLTIALACLLLAAFAGASRAEAAVTAFILNDSLVVSGDPEDNQITLQVVAGDTSRIEVIDGTTVVDRFARSTFSTIVINVIHGNDTVTLSGAFGPITEPATINGGPGNDTIRGGAGSDTLNGGIDNDRIIWNPGDGSDVIVGGDGFDVFELSGSSAADEITITRNPAAPRITVTVGTIATDVSTIEHIVVNGGDGDDRIVASGDLALITNLRLEGGSGDDIVRGGNGADVLLGGPGLDKLSGLQGDDVIFGGPGDDVIFWTDGRGRRTRSKASWVRLPGVVRVPGHRQNRDCSQWRPRPAHPRYRERRARHGGVESIWGRCPTEATTSSRPRTISPGLALRNSSCVAATAATSSLAATRTDVLDGGAGVDFLHGGAGNDNLSGGADEDVIRGNAGTMSWPRERLDGNDRFFGGNGEDRVRVIGRLDADVLVVKPSTLLDSRFAVERDGDCPTLEGDGGGPRHLTTEIAADRITMDGDLTDVVIAIDAGPGPDIISTRPFSQDRREWERGCRSVVLQRDRPARVGDTLHDRDRGHDARRPYARSKTCGSRG